MIDKSVGPILVQRVVVMHLKVTDDSQKHHKKNYLLTG